MKSYLYLHTDYKGETQSVTHRFVVRVYVTDYMLTLEKRRDVGLRKCFISNNDYSNVEAICFAVSFLQQILTQY